MRISGAAKWAAHDVAPSWLRRLFVNVAWGVALGLRAPRTTAERSRHAYARVAFGAITAVPFIAVIMVFVDGPVAEAAKRTPRWLAVVFAELTDFGKSGWFLWPIGILLLVIAVAAKPTLTQGARLMLAAIAVRAGFLFAAIATPSLVVTVLKRLIGRARPFVGPEANPFLYKPLVWGAQYASMPSGHATTAFAAAVAIAALWPRMRLPMLIYAGGIMVSRVVLDAHYTSDVIVGAFVGTVGAFLVRDWFAARRLGFVICGDGHVRALPGPSFIRIKRVARSLTAP